MSLEFQLAGPCPHISLDEVVALDGDRRSLFTRQSVASLGSVRVTANDDQIIPASGLYTTAQLISSVSGPFDLNQGEDSLMVTTPRGTQSISLGVMGTQRLTGAQVVKELLRRGLTVAFPEESTGYLLLSDTSTVGPESYVRVGGPAASLLGFGAAGVSDRLWGAVGKQVYPGWRLANKGVPGTLDRYPQFVSRVQPNPVFRVSYATTAARCLRCRATHVENDIHHTQAGDAILIQNEDLLYQAVLKILLTDIGSNPFFPWYGSTIRSRIGAKALGGVAALISEDVRKALSRVQKLQVEQSKYQQVTLKEKLYAIQSVQVLQHEQDPTTFLVDVVVQNASGEPVSLSIVYAAPGVVSLMGTNGLFLGQEPAGVKSMSEVWR